jgi:hypothetical protein
MPEWLCRLFESNGMQVLKSVQCLIRMVRGVVAKNDAILVAAIEY